LLGIETLPDEQKLGMLERVTELVQKRLLLRVLESLNSGQKAEFEKLLEQGDQEAINVYIEHNVPQLSQWVGEETSAVKEELATWVKGTLGEK
jgi:succinate dehydrogenase flavin-adding protein (antitoxin of CptAB toxin-antitoxin module)